MKRLLSVAAACLTAFTAAAQDYPSKPVTMIVTFPAGSVIDLAARGIAQLMDPRLNQRILIVNRPGGGETIGMTAVAQAPADGYTLAYTPVTPLTIQPYRMKNLAYARDQFIPLCQTFENIFYIGVAPRSEWTTFTALLAAAKANPGKLRYTTAGVGSSPHLAGADLWQKAGVQLVDVPYPGDVAAVPHLLAGDVELGVYTTFTIATQKLRPLAVFAAERTKRYPDVPTVTELGYRVLPSGYGGLFVRSGTPDAIVARLEAACRDAANDPAFTDLVEKQYQQLAYTDRAAFTARIEADYRAKGVLLPTLKLPE